MTYHLNALLLLLVTKGLGLKFKYALSRDKTANLPNEA